MSDFRATLEAAGLRPRAVVPDGRWHRCPTDDKPKRRNGAFVLHPDGRGAWRNWATDDSVSTWSPERAHHAPAVDPARLSAQRQREREARIAAIRSARAFWDRAKPLNRLHPYVERKGLSALGCAGLRAHDGALVVPVHYAGRITSVQTIQPDGTKRFAPGAPVKAGAYVIDRPRAAITCICEGLATGLAVFQSLRTARVIVAFDCGNLLPAVQALKPVGAVVICADNDHITMARRGFNPGLDKARNVADLIGCGVAYPTGISGTDWADALAEWGAPAPRKIERLITAAIRYVGGAAMPNTT